MSNNYQRLKQDEEHVLKLFNSSFLSIINFFKKQIELIEKKPKVEKLEKQLDIVISEDSKNLTMIRDILEECVWLIQKHEPRANHLRLLIAIINSLSDLKRMSSYVVTFAKFFIKNLVNIDDTIKNEILKISRYCLEVSEEYYILISKFQLETMKDKSNTIFNKFLKNYKKLYSDLINSKNPRNIKDSIMASYVIVLKNIDRNIDHCVNIVENFCGII